MSNCKEWSFIEYVKNSSPSCPGFELEAGDDEFINDVVAESLNIAAAKVNVFKLLGIHEQGQMMDLIGSGVAVSGGDGNAHPAFNAFNKLCGEWRSKQRGSKVVEQSFIGYDFGPIVDSRTGEEYYGVETYDHVHITTIKIRQGAKSNNRASKIRIERSQDGVKWYGAQVVALPDDQDLHTIHFRGSAASRYWRLRPTEFTGGANDWWAVSHLEMHEYEKTALTNIQDDMGFVEMRDRDYSDNPIMIKMYYDLSDVYTDLSGLGMGLDNQQLYLTVSFKDSVSRLGRPFVIGDIIEIVKEAQYTPTLDRVKKYMEITDVSWSSDGYTPSWQPTLQRIVAEPMIASQETLDIVPYSNKPDSMGFIEIDQSQVTDQREIQARNTAQAEIDVPQRGHDLHAIHHFSEEEIAEAAERGVDIRKLNTDRRALYIEDGLPPNGEEYTEGPTLPTNPRSGDWHRLTYSAVDNRIPPRLYKFLGSKNRWIFMETDRRTQYDVLKPTVQDLITSQTSTAASKFGK